MTFIKTNLGINTCACPCASMCVCMCMHVCEFLTNRATGKKYLGYQHKHYNDDKDTRLIEKSSIIN